MTAAIRPMKIRRYYGSFQTPNGTTWRVEIWQRGFSGEAQELTFPADSPLVIEWNDSAKENVIVSSAATLRVESPGDRTFFDLYTEEVGAIELRVRRNNILYWVGTLDTELYEEPYEKARYYDTQLTFSDFGCWDRLKCRRTTWATLTELLQDAIEDAGLEQLYINQGMTSLERLGSNKLGSISVDVSCMAKDGDLPTHEEIIEEALKPLGLKIQQRDAIAYVYDLNGLYNSREQRQIEWSGTSQTLSVDRIYNSVSVSWEPNVLKNRIPSEVWTERVDSDLVWPPRREAYGYECDRAVIFPHDPGSWQDELTQPEAWYDYHFTLGEWWRLSYKYGRCQMFSVCLAHGGYGEAAFSFWWSKYGDNMEIPEDSPAAYFKVVPQEGGESAEGVSVLWTASMTFEDMDASPSLGRTWHFTGVTTNPFGADYRALKSPAMSGTPEGEPIFAKPLLRSPKVMLPPKAHPVRLNIVLPMLLSFRVDPFAEVPKEKASPDTPGLGAEEQELAKKVANICCVPVRIFFKEAGTNDIYYYDNREVIERPCDSSGDLSSYMGRWVPFAGGGYGYLAYYKPDNIKKDCGIGGGWAKNYQVIPSGAAASGVIQDNVGQHIPYPGAGEIWLEVLDKGWGFVKYGQAFTPGQQDDQFGLWKETKWILFKTPEITLELARDYDTEIDDSSVEYYTELNPYAKEALEISTKYGTAREDVAGATGVYIKTITGNSIAEFSRAGKRGTAEVLLCGTLYSQYAERKVKLSGECELIYGGVQTYTEQNQGDRRFMILSDEQDLIAGTSEIEMVELSEEEYTEELDEDL